MATGTPRIKGHGVATTMTARARTGSPLNAQAPPAKAIPKINPQDQVADDAAAVGMTTQDAPEETAPLQQLTDRLP